MKKLIHILGILTLLMAGAACNNSDNGDPQDNEFPDGIQPVVLADELGDELGEELTAFFEENLRFIAGALFYEFHESLGTGNKLVYLPHVDTCVMINSVEDFRAIDFTIYENNGMTFELPPIDFDAYTLIIGQWVAMHGGIRLFEQAITVEPELTIMNLVIGVKRNENMSYTQALEVDPFWGLYPKLTSEPIQVNVVRKFK